MTSQQKSSVGPMIIIGALFFIFGFVTWLNNVLIPFLKQACELTDFQAYFVTFAFYISYFVMAVPSSWILNKVGFTKGMSVGLAIMAIGSFVFIPAAMMRSYPLFLVGLFAQATGLTLLQNASNPYVTILGPIESAAKRISIMGVCNKMAGVIGILLLAEVLFNDTEALSARIATLQGVELDAQLDELARRLITPYVIIGIGFLLLAAVVTRAHLPEINPEQQSAGEGGKSSDSIFRYTYLWLGVLCIFTYVGVEVIAIDTLALYGQYHGLDLNTSSKLGVYSLFAFTAGYLIGTIIIPKIISQQAALRLCAILSILFAAGALVTEGNVSIGFIVALSFAHSLMWPSIWPLAIEGLGKFTKVGSSFLIMAIVGGALLPLVYGWLADNSNRQSAYWMLFPCYAYILFFASSGYKMGRTKPQLDKAVA